MAARRIRLARAIGWQFRRSRMSLVVTWPAGARPTATAAGGLRFLVAPRLRG